MVNGKVVSLEELIKAFFIKTLEDPRIAAVHISLFVSLAHLCGERGFDKPLLVFSYDVMPLCKISASSTYHKAIRQLNEYGYIIYEPSRNHFSGSMVVLNVK